ncbi:hypothetical protein ACFYNY_24760 [Streptomyces sp. NPDC006530]|uniref:hypothetical protein n=1 Tax=Streptomyces sp. NPDC006530 TaxID=3364750 RepID=UPI0036B276E4
MRTRDRVDRLTFSTTIIETGAPSYRLARSKAGQDIATEKPEQPPWGSSAV